MFCGILETLLFILGFVWTVIIIFRLPKDISEFVEARKKYVSRFDPESYKWEIGIDKIDNEILVKQYREQVEQRYKATFITYVCVLWPITAIYIIWFLLRTVKIIFILL